MLRIENRELPPLTIVDHVMRDVAAVRATARERGIVLTGVQLDIDCPTSALGGYAKFLAAIRARLPKDTRLSITALLDWFRPGTGIAAVVEQVDEFVPQFYDVEPQGVLPKYNTVAAPVVPAKWARLFSQFEKPFRIGISTFGRSRFIPASKDKGSFYSDGTPFDAARTPGMELTVERTPAKEVILRYTAARATSAGYRDYDAGDRIEFSLATPESIAEPVRAAREFGPYCAGVVFFRWPEEGEFMTVPPDDVFTAAGAGHAARQAPRLEVRDERCAAVHCTDLKITHTPAWNEKAVVFVVSVSLDMEYFIPNPGFGARMVSPRRIEITLPPYCGRIHLPLGRAVAAQPVQFRLETRT